MPRPPIVATHSATGSTIASPIASPIARPIARNNADEPALPALPHISGYRVISELGKGGTATVYLAVQQSLGRKVALKVSNQSSTDTAAVERFLREAKIMSQLSHPYIVAVHEVGHAGDRHYIAMEYLGGGNLRQRIRNRNVDNRSIDIDEAVRIIAQITQALDFAHDKGFLHRDIKPGNILFRHDGSAVLTDFGIARATSPSSLRAAPAASATSTVLGTPRYMSPEQAKGKALDRRSDLYAIGVLLFELLTGKVPFDGDDALDIGIKHLKARVPLLPPALAPYQTVVEKMLAKDPDQRYQRGQPFIETLYRVQAVTSEKTASDVIALAHPLGRRRLMLLVMLMLLIVAIAIARTGATNA